MNDKRTEKPITSGKLTALGIGNALLIIFLITMALLITGAILMIRKMGFKELIFDYWGWLLIFTTTEIMIFWTGIIMVYITSIQLGIKMRVIGILAGMIPVVNIIVLVIIISITGREYRFEKKKLKIDNKRKADRICATKYPLLMVHGVFFRDFKNFNYWGRIPEELERNGAVIYYGNHQSASSVEDSARELAQRIMQIVSETGCGKVNIIAHSKGGLDSKTAVSYLGMSPYVASITTINTPHRGCEFAEYLLQKAPVGLKERVAGMYNAALHKLGDENPSFIAAVTDLTASRCRMISEITDSFDYRGAGVYTQSVGSCMKKATSGAFPLNMSYNLVGYFDGKNDGLVGEPSFKWGENYTFLENKKKKGISHGDMIDLSRENIKGFDVREFYVQLVAGLKARGL